MTQKVCPTPEELTRQVALGPDEQFSAHLDSCETCAQAFSSESSLVGMFQSLPFGEPDAAQLRNVKQSILERTNEAKRQDSPLLVPIQPRPARTFRWLALAAAVVLAVGATWVMTSSNGKAPTPEQTQPTLANIQASAETKFQHTGSSNDEIVRLQNGTVTVQVLHLAPGQRFRVITGDAEVEVRGTRFDVTAKDDKLVSVFVHEGKVEVRPANGAQTLLTPSQTWASPSASTPTSTPTTLSQNDTPVLNKPEPKTPKNNNAKAAEEAFTKGMSQMTAKEFAAAAESFSLVTTLDPNSPLAEEARLRYAFSLYRGGEKAKATRALTAFIAKYPNSARRGEAAVALGRLYVDAGALDDAQIMFESALDDPAAQKSAQDGLSTISKLRQSPQ
jgi:TolA-binding protein